MALDLSLKIQDDNTSSDATTNKGKKSKNMKNPLKTPSGIEVQFIMPDDNQIEISTDEAIVFNNILESVGTDIDYNLATGEFDLSSGVYVVDFWLFTNSSGSANSVALQVDGTTHSTARMMSESGHTSVGHGLLHIENGSSTITLINPESRSLYFSSFPDLEDSKVIGSIIIYKL